MILKLEIDSDNEACRTRADVADIITRAMGRLRTADENEEIVLKDVNGNRVGFFVIELDSED